MASIDTRQKKIFGDGKLTRAVLKYKSYSGGNDVTLSVQFNPTEYSITRASRHKETNGKGEEASPEKVQMKNPSLANLKVNLILDTSTYMPMYSPGTGLSKYLNDDKELTLICQELALLTKIHPESHAHSKVTFSWGATSFWGYVISLGINYQMFNLDGMPVRASVDMEMVGEELDILTKVGANPKSSPDRTKFRRLNQKEELWMIADTEYNDTAYWKEIAKENGILNPRKIDYTKRLKVPAL